MLVQRLHHLQAVGFGDKQARTRVAQDVAQLRAARGGVDGHGHRAYPGAAQQHLHELGAVGTQQGHAVAGAQAGALQHGAVGLGLVQGLGKTPAHLTGHKQRSVAVALGLAAQQLGHGAPLGREVLGKSGQQVHGGRVCELAG